jgi:hypothetical protein
MKDFKKLLEKIFEINRELEKYGLEVNLSVLPQKKEKPK